MPVTKSSWFLHAFDRSNACFSFCSDNSKRLSVSHVQTLKLKEEVLCVKYRYFISVFLLHNEDVKCRLINERE